MTVFISSSDPTETIGAALASGAVTDCYVNSETQAAKGIALDIANESGSTQVVLIYWYDATSSVAYCIGGYSIADDRSVQHDLQGIRLDVGDKIQVGGGAAGVDVVVTVTPFHGPG